MFRQNVGFDFVWKNLRCFDGKGDCVETRLAKNEILSNRALLFAWHFVEGHGFRQNRPCFDKIWSWTDALALYWPLLASGLHDSGYWLLALDLATDWFWALMAPDFGFWLLGSWPLVGYGRYGLYDLLV